LSNTSTSLRRYRSSLLFQKDHTNNSVKSAASVRLELSNLDYKENLRTMSMTSLISEMCSLRRDLVEGKKEFVDSPSYEISPKLVEQKEAMIDKVLAVEIEIGRRLRATHKMKK
jgi:hypothetical protein